VTKNIAKRARTSEWMKGLMVRVTRKASKATRIPAEYSQFLQYMISRTAEGRKEEAEGGGRRGGLTSLLKSPHHITYSNPPDDIITSSAGLVVT